MNTQTTTLALLIASALSSCAPAGDPYQQPMYQPPFFDGGTYVPTDVSARWRGEDKRSLMRVVTAQNAFSWPHPYPPDRWEMAPWHGEYEQGPDQGSVTLDRIDGGVRLDISGQVSRYKSAAGSTFRFELCRDQPSMDVEIRCTGVLGQTLKGTADVTVWFDGVGSGTEACYGTSSDIYSRQLTNKPGLTVTHTETDGGENCQLIEGWATADMGEFNNMAVEGSASMQVRLEFFAR